MDNRLDRTLDEILAERKQNNRGGSRGGRRRGDRSDNPRDGVRKPFRDDAPRNLDSEWVHDRFEDYGSRRSETRRRYSPEPSSDSRGSKLRVDNLHYELTQEDLEGLFNQIGPVIRVEIKYDRAGRSEGVAFVTYESHRDALQAIKEYDGANAAGQPIRLTLIPAGPARRNPFDTAVAPGRPLAERITLPPGRSRSLSPGRGYDDEEGSGGGTGGRGGGRRHGGGGGGGDRYRPGGGSGRGSRSRSPMPARRRDGGGRRSGARRDGGGGRRGERGGGGGARPKKTQEELDAEMEDYFAGGGGAQQADGGAGPAPEAAGVNGAGGPAAQQAQVEDVEMIE
ncbi:hypothetical protein VTK26DRAFT_9395 [Humicola hyalothermophila]